MIDLHCHILPGMDDGSKNMDVSVQMCRIARQNGIKHIVCTPHITTVGGYRQFCKDKERKSPRSAGNNKQSRSRNNTLSRGRGLCR